MISPVQRLLGRLELLPGRGARGWKAVCPLATGDREDRRQHVVSITVDQRGAVGLFCHGGCRTEDVLAAIELRLSDLYPPRQVAHGRRGPAMSDAVRLARAGVSDDEVQKVLARARAHA